MNNELVFHQIRTFRELQGLTQQELARLSRVSVPMIQLIEGNKANPSIEVLSRVCGVLGIELSFKVQVDPREQVGLYFGLVVSETPARIRMLNSESLEQWLKMGKDRATEAPERVHEAWESVLLAIYEYYPSYFQRLEISPPKKVTGRIIKLKRIALERLVEVMNS